MLDDPVSRAELEPAQDPRSVSRGSKLQLGFLGLDSLYLVMEYPHADVFNNWSVVVSDFTDARLHEGIPFGDMVVRRGGLGYKLSVWDGDTRLYITDRVTDALCNTAHEGQGMGLMLQLSPKWLRQFGDILSERTFSRNILAQFALFGVHEPEKYPVRLNRMDITADVIGLDVAGFSVDDWNRRWVGYAMKKDFHFSALTGQLEGLSIGSSEGAVRFKVYDKIAESQKKGTARFWRSVWGVNADDEIAVARFEWSVKCYSARFAEMRFLSDFTFEGFLELLNYVSLKWGRLCEPQADDSNRSRWPLGALWADLRGLIEAWDFGFSGTAHREYDFRPEISDSYLRSLAGWISGLQVRIGLETGKDAPASFGDGLFYLDEHGHTLPDIQRKAEEKWRVASRLAGKWAADDKR